MHSDQRYIFYLKENNLEGIQEIYRLYAEKVKRFIQKHNGDDDDAADIFQEALIDIYHLAHKPDFKLTCPFEPFLIIVCKRKWLNVLKKRSSQPVTNRIEDVYTHGVVDEATDEYLVVIERENALMEVLETMGDRCKEIIKACMGDDHQEKIAAALGLTYAYLRKKKSECMQVLGQKVKAHPLFRKKNTSL